jgi:hypothetical protein
MTKYGFVPPGQRRYFPRAQSPSCPYAKGLLVQCIRVASGCYPSIACVNNAMAGGTGMQPAYIFGGAGTQRPQHAYGGNRPQGVQYGQYPYNPQRPWYG